MVSNVACESLFLSLSYVSRLIVGTKDHDKLASLLKQHFTTTLDDWRRRTSHSVTGIGEGPTSELRNLPISHVPL